MSAVKEIGRTFQAARDDIDAMRDRLATLKEERRGVEATPADFAAITARVDEWLAQRQKRGGLNFPFLGDPDGFNFVNLDEFIGRQMEKRPDELFAALMPDALRAALLSGAPRDGITTDDRAARLLRIAQQMLVTEIAEELALRQIEGATGADMMRRADADPAILLAPTAELEAGGRKR